jgi:hypothetical protein
MLMTLPLTFALESQHCSNLFQGFTSLHAGHLEASLQKTVPLEDIEISRTDWKVEITFSQRVELINIVRI